MPLLKTKGELVQINNRNYSNNGNKPGSEGKESIISKRPILPKSALETFDSSLSAKNVAAKKYAGRAIVYLWFNKLTGEIYVGSSYGKTRLNDYFASYYLKKSASICKSISKYGHINFILMIMEDLGPITDFTHAELFAVEQTYINWNFKTNGELCLNRHTIAKGGNVLISRRLGKNNPMYGKVKSPEFIAQQKRDKTGENNPQ